MSDDADAEFTRLAKEYLDDRAERHPDLATDLGDHRFDDRLPDRSAAALAGERRALDGWAARLNALDTSALSAEHRVDAAMMADSVERRVFEIDELHEHTWNPLLANPGKAIYRARTSGRRRGGRQVAPGAAHLRPAVHVLRGVHRGL
jgi:uncharacterized protein (DUF885 family)